MRVVKQFLFSHTQENCLVALKCVHLSTLPVMSEVTNLLQTCAVCVNKKRDKSLYDQKKLRSFSLIYYESKGPVLSNYS